MSTRSRGFASRLVILFVIVIIGILVAGYFGYKIFHSKQPITVNSLQTYATDFGTITGQKSEKICSYGASKSDKYCSTISIVKVTYADTQSPLKSSHDWRSVASPFDIFTRNEKDKLVCAIRQTDAENRIVITFFTRDQSATDLSCAKL